MEQEERRRWDERKNRDDDLVRDWTGDEEQERRESRAHSLADDAEIS
jgi:hypothetical protein